MLVLPGDYRCILIVDLINKSYICEEMENDIAFDAYLNAKKIDSARFKEKESALYAKLSGEFEQVHPDSFTAQKLFLINPIRRKYLLKEVVEENVSKPKNKFKPKIR